MRTPTEDEITAVIDAHPDPMYLGLTEKEQRDVVEICLTLGTPVTPVFTSEMFLTLVRRVVAVEQRARVGF